MLDAVPGVKVPSSIISNVYELPLDKVPKADESLVPELIEVESVHC